MSREEGQLVEVIMEAAISPGDSHPPSSLLSGGLKPSLSIREGQDGSRGGRHEKEHLCGTEALLDDAEGCVASL